MKMITLGGLLMAAALLAGCAPKAPKTIDYWGDYQQQIYSYYQKDSDPQKQIEALNLDVEKARAVNQPVAPGCTLSSACCTPKRVIPLKPLASLRWKNSCFRKPALTWIF